jgi:hypothetical protein
MKAHLLHLVELAAVVIRMMMIIPAVGVVPFPVAAHPHNMLKREVKAIRIQVLKMMIPMKMKIAPLVQKKVRPNSIQKRASKVIKVINKLETSFLYWRQ